MAPAIATVALGFFLPVIILVRNTIYGLAIPIPLLELLQRLALKELEQIRSSTSVPLDKGDLPQIELMKYQP